MRIEPLFAQGIGQVGAPVAPEPKTITFWQLLGWTRPYVEAIAYALISVGVGWIAKRINANSTDTTLRDALTVFLQNRANSLIADGYVSLKQGGGGFHVNDTALANEVATASAAIPDAMKWFNLTPEVVKQKIIDAIPQTNTGAILAANAIVQEPVADPALAPEEERPSPSAAPAEPDPSVTQHAQ